MAPPPPTFKRGQVEWAIWRLFTLLKATPPDPPPVFLTRIKRLLEADRQHKVPAGQDYEPPARFAFSSEESEGQGIDAAFTPFDAFCLALALDLVDFGFKPSEIVFLLRYLRPELEDQFDAIIREPPPPLRQRQSAKARPNLPSYTSKGTRYADGRVFWVIQKVELKEIYSPVTRRNPKASPPLFLNPRFCRGLEALSAELGEMNHEQVGYRKALVLEIAYLAKELTGLLSVAPLTRRGRPS
jgi:hypothetical protein